MDESLLLKIGDVEEKHWWFAVRRRIVLQAIGDAVATDDLRVLEIGCGTGGFMLHLKRSYPKWTVQGVEPNAAAVHVAQDRGCPVSVGALPDLDAPDSQTDLVIALDVLEHCEDDGAAMRRIYDILAPDGLLVVTVPALPSLWSIHDEDNAHFRRYTKASLQRLLAGSGFQTERLTYFNMLLLPLGYASRAMANVTRSRKALGVDTPPEPLNGLLKALFGLEATALRHADLPVGMSLLAVARKENPS
ncbi:MAG: class I SAM-dependent methyltransferase [Anaerosomatales bacterium]|nr:class I SAM-dependent methyltransferase [Anaerosomatales bacterium]